MGIHPSLSSKFLSTNKPLSEDNSINIPFLFKVLSVNTALSIQAHPNK
jgi:mannose-6-phosphate isomerase class I